MSENSTERSGRSPLRGVVTMLSSALSNQVGAALGAHAFGVIGPAGVVAVRQVVAGAGLLPGARPPLRRMTWSQWWPVLLLAVVFGCMNLSLYTAIDRIGLGLAVTLEFLGPLGVALAGSRARRGPRARGAAAGPADRGGGRGRGLRARAARTGQRPGRPGPGAGRRGLLGGLHRA